MWIVTVGSGLLADWVRKRKILSTTTVRKLANGLGKLAVPKLKVVFKDPKSGQ